MGDPPTDRGSVLMLFPAAFLIMLVLGALAIDAGVVFLHQRDLAAAAGAAANDAATLGLDLVRLRDGGEPTLDADLVEAAVLSSLQRRGVLDRLAATPTVEVSGTTTIAVTLVSHVDYVIAPTLPGNHSGRLVRVTVRTDAVLDS